MLVKSFIWTLKLNLISKKPSAYGHNLRLHFFWNVLPIKRHICPCLFHLKSSTCQPAYTESITTVSTTVDINSIDRSSAPQAELIQWTDDLLLLSIAPIFPLIFSAETTNTQRHTHTHPDPPTQIYSTNTTSSVRPTVVVSTSKLSVQLTKQLLIKVPPNFVFPHCRSFLPYIHTNTYICI